MKKWFHILIVISLLLAAGCQREPRLDNAVSGLVLTVRCEDPALTKVDPEPADGETRFNENLIKSVDFFFYPGETPASDADAVYHHRVDLDEDPVIYTEGQWEATFNIVLTRVVAEQIFTAANNMKATVYAVVNYSGDLAPGDSMDGTSLSELAATAVITDFASTEKEYIQNSFLMDGKTVITYDESAPISASGTIKARRFAAKMTTAISVASEVTLKHTSTDDPSEVWTPVLHTMRIYLVDGAKNVELGTESGADNTSPEYFSYSDEARRRPFLRDNGTEFLAHTSVGSGSSEKIYYNTYPMYSYPVAWSNGQPDYTQSLPAQPYLKLEMDWRRTETNGYSYDRRKYYYKVILPVSSLERNYWYHFNIDVSILGSETDEGKALLNPTTYYILDWQNKTRYPQVFDYYKKLIALRKHHLAFRMGNANSVQSYLDFLSTPAFTVAYRLNGHATDDQWNDIIVILNANREAVSVDIPDGVYKVVCCDGQIDEKGLGEVDGNRVMVSPQSALIIHN